ncbi:MAG: HAD-IA family hydrolase, partial [Candidatus Acidiferrales bacterium]
ALAFLGSISQQKKYLVAALNNESREINEYRIRTFHLRDYFEAFFCSCYLGVRKPNAGIYNLALQITQSTPQECVMIDDRGINLESAKEIGMHTIQVKSLPQLKADLGALGVIHAS